MIRDSDWDMHLAQHHEATFYHTRRWWQILQTAFPRLRDDSYWIECGRVRAAMPLHTWDRLAGILSTSHSSFPFLYGGPVPRHIDGRDLLAETLVRLARGRCSLHLVSNPFTQGETDRPSTISVTPDSTHILILPPSHEEYWKNYLTTAKRNDVRRLTKKGVTIRLGASPEEVAVVYRFYRASFQRWGGKPGFVYPEALYRAMMAHGGDAVRLYLAEHEKRIIGGAFIIRWNGHVHYHAGYFDHTARSLRPNVLLQERVIHDAITDGFVEYDFLPSGGNPGVETFKESFGGVRTHIDRYEYRSPLHRALRLLRGHPQR